VLQVNFFAPIMLARGLLDELKAAKGSVVNVTSIAGSRVHPFAGAAYSTSKAALAALTREMAADFGPLGIRVNAIAPGEIDTAMLSPGTESIIPHIPLHRLGTTDEVRRSSTCCAPRLVLCERRRDPHQRRPARLGRIARVRELVRHACRHAMTHSRASGRSFSLAFAGPTGVCARAASCSQVSAICSSCWRCDGSAVRAISRHSAACLR
jgi:NAD(P)-dependent dehydrogenase (short-subunit alcohol dehydrogenase family)